VKNSIIPGSNYILSNIKKVVLIDSAIYSGGNDCCAYMRSIPNTLIIGTKSGGGGGTPLSSMLPNNWVLTFPRGKFYNSAYQSLEEGVTPDNPAYVPKKYWDTLTRVAVPDPVIKKALQYLNSHR
jgi:C-terminal processing protease CtpA/Prc